MNETTNATAPHLEEAKENITQAGISAPPIDASLLAEVESAPKNITASKQLIIVPVLWHTKPTENLWVYTYYDCALITDKTEVDFTASDSWSMSQINTMLNTSNQLTVVRPMKSSLKLEFDKPHYEAGESATLKIQLYIGSATQATIDGKLAAANKTVLVTIPTKDEGMITLNVTTNGTGAGEIKFTMPSGGGHVKITAHFDCDELHIGSAKVDSYFYVMPPLLALLYALLPVALICLVVYVFLRYVVLRFWRGAFFGPENGD
ncbi:MAG: hypothetical protein QME47_08155 [Candidatus Thermoplasmatota archaeon]|nr:hypothetical protein [Candidatus Thermoplasmatota archaeon]